MRSEMSSRERLIAALKREEVDYVPCCASFNSLTPLQLKGRDGNFTWGPDWKFPWDPNASLEDRLEYAVGKLGLDQVVPLVANPCRPVAGVESRVWIEDDILHKVYTTPSGELHASVNYSSRWPHGEDIPFYSDFNVGHFIEPWLQNESDLECLKQIQKLTDAKEALEQARLGSVSNKALSNRYGLATICHVGMGLTGAMHLFGASDLCVMMIDNPGLVDAYLDYEHRINLRKIELLGELGVDILRRNGFYETADFYGPDMLEEFLGPRLRLEADAAHGVGIRTSYTAHTGIMPILDYLASLTIDSLFGIDIGVEGMDLPKLRDILAPTKSFWIGPSSLFHILQGPDVTRQAVRTVFDVFGKTGLILSPCVSSHSSMPWESTMVMIEEWKHLR